MNSRNKGGKMDSQEYSRVRHWLLAIRPKTLPAAAGPVVVGTAAAIHDNAFSALPALAAFLVALLLQIGVNLANDYFDAKNKIDSEKRLGPVRVTQAGLISAEQVKWAMLACLAAASVVFMYLAWVGGPVMIAVAVASVLAALAYSGGPYPLASHGLGELFVFIFFGPVAVCSTYYVQALSFTSLSVVASCVPGVLITAIMVINNLRDIPTDSVAGKHTLAVRLGQTGAIRFYRILLVSCYVVPLYLFVKGTVGAMMLLSLLSAPMAVVLSREVGVATGEALNETLARTAQFSLFGSILFSLGLVL